MKQKKPERPLEEEYDNIMFNEAGSANDCTGLIPSAVLDRDQYESYEALEDFNVPEIYRDCKK